MFEGLRQKASLAFSCRGIRGRSICHCPRWYQTHKWRDYGGDASNKNTSKEENCVNRDSEINVAKRFSDRLDRTVSMALLAVQTIRDSGRYWSRNEKDEYATSHCRQQSDGLWLDRLKVRFPPCDLGFRRSLRLYESRDSCWITDHHDLGYKRQL